MKRRSDRWQNVAGKTYRDYRASAVCAVSVLGSDLSRRGVCGMFSVADFYKRLVSRYVDNQHTAQHTAYFPAVVERVSNVFPAKRYTAYFPPITMRVSAIPRYVRYVFLTPNDFWVSLGALLYHLKLDKGPENIPRHTAHTAKVIMMRVSAAVCCAGSAFNIPRHTAGHSLANSTLLEV